MKNLKQIPVNEDIDDFEEVGPKTVFD